MPRSVEGISASVSVAVLFASLRSAPFVPSSETETVVVNDPVADGPMSSDRSALTAAGATGKEPIASVQTDPAFRLGVHAQPAVELAALNVVPAGMVTDIAAPVASCVPTLSYVTV